MRPFYILENSIQPYAWGSTDGIPSIAGLPNPDDKPMAELWMGAHPASPSVAVDGTERIKLDALIAARPADFLGETAIRRFGNELPFLFKILSAARPLSLQVHPTREQAYAGFVREYGEEIPLLDPRRNYRDPNPKREILMALSPFTAMCGFRVPKESIRLLTAISCPALDACIHLISREGNEPGYIRFYRHLLELDEETQAEIIARASEQARAQVLESQSSRDPADRQAYDLLLSLADLYPTDIGILSPLYLNIVNLDPGEAFHIPSGIIHSYVKGTGIELMTNSDNTLRCGLTPKHRNVPELYSILEDIPFLPDIVKPDETAAIYGYRPLFPEFALIRVTLAATDDDRATTVPFRNGAPAIALGMTGELRMSAGGDSIVLSKGVSVFVPASIPVLEFSGAGTAYVATVPEA